MEYFKNLARVIVSMLLSLVTLFLCGFIYFNDGSTQVWNDTSSKEPLESIKVENVSSSFDTESKETETVAKEETKEKENIQSVPESTQSTVQTSGDNASALGKIVEQFLSPYSASLSHNNVYIKNSTPLNIDLKSELSQPLKIKINKSKEPQVLILHTHATESYMKEERDYYTASDLTRTTDNAANMINIGNIIAERLKVGGFSVIHDKTQHDASSYSGSYTKAEKTITEYLKKYPSIKIVIDVHRDSISLGGGNKAKPTVEINGRKAAQVMLCMGSESGAVTGFPNWKENFRLAAHFQQTMEVMYPGLARPMLLMSKKYNEHLTTGSMLLEVGTEANTLAEASYTAELVGNCLINLFNTLG